MGIFVNKEIRYGCGSGIFFIKDHFFQSACKGHDIGYMDVTGTRKTIDKKFLNDMLILAKKKKIYIPLAYIFYGIVRLVGGYFYNKHVK